MPDKNEVKDQSLIPQEKINTNLRPTSNLAENASHHNEESRSINAIVPLSESRVTKFSEQLDQIWITGTALRLGTHLLSIVAVIIVAWGMRQFYINLRGLVASQTRQQAMSTSLSVPTGTPQVPIMPELGNLTKYSGAGIHRLPNIYTTIPNRPRLDVLTYVVQPKDTVTGIAEIFNLRASTILWGNYETLRDDPHRLKPGQVLNILPTDGTYYQWHTNDGLNGVAKFFGVSIEAIINWPGNHLTKDVIADLTNPKITPGFWLFIPGGHRDFVTWSAPRITRDNPSVAKVLGPGFCGAIDHGPMGKGAFIWPTNNHYLSGYNYSPETNHNGIDIDGNSGDPVYAVDDGVVVYSGWNNWGYGYVIVIDHGNGWQSLYAHLSAISVGCGQFVFQGNTIGAIGATGNASGPHLHFELLNDTSGKANPWNYLP